MSLSLPTWRSDLPAWLYAHGYRVGAEIGVFRGEFTIMLAEAGLEVFAVDPWAAYDLEPRQAREDFLYNHTQRVLARFPQCHIIRASSMDAVTQFADGSLDFVYIDGDHTAEAIAHDLRAWNPKVRAGGVVSGHDYSGNRSTSVRPVVDAWVAAHGLSLQLIGVHGAPGWRERGDRRQSFMWVMP